MNFFKKLLWCKNVFVKSIDLSLNNKILDKASALSFATLLGLVPLISIVFIVLNSLNNLGLESIVVNLNKFSDSFLHNNKEFIVSVVSIISQFVEHAEELKGISIFGLCFSVFLLLHDMENNLKEIFKTKNFTLLNKLELFLLVIVLIPLFAIVMLGGVIDVLIDVLNFVFKVFHLKERTFFLDKWIGFFSIVLINSLLFMNCGRKIICFKDALVGGFVAAIGFFGSQYLLELWLSNIPTYSKIYGVFAFIPVFLLYVEFCWISFLYGAILSKSIASVKS